MGDTSKISPQKTQEALAAIVSRQNAELAELKEFLETRPKTPNVWHKEREAYLRGRLAGLNAAYHEFEGRSPVILLGG